jgi:hypothetical protein
MMIALKHTKKLLSHRLKSFLAFTERGRFELPLGVTPNLISSQTHSTTLPPLQISFAVSFGKQSECNNITVNMLLSS